MKHPKELGATFTGPENKSCLMASLGCVELRGFWAEFGVFTGRSLSRIAEFIAPSKVYGFDSFEGLPEGWIFGFPKGTFGMNKDQFEALKWPENAMLVKGWFEDTLPKFLEDMKGPAAFVHIDSDLYSSAKTVLGLLKDRIIPSTIIVFDEYHGYDKWEDGEAKAFEEFLAETGKKARCMFYGPMQAAFVVVGNNE